MNRNTALHKTILMLLLLFPPHAMADDIHKACLDPRDILGEKLEYQINLLEDAVKERGFSNENAKKYISHLRNRLCKSLLEKQISRKETINSIRLTHADFLFCDLTHLKKAKPSPLVVRARERNRLSDELFLQATESFCRTLGIEGRRSPVAVRALETLVTQLFCLESEYLQEYLREEFGFLAVFASDAPGWSEVKSAIESACGDLKEGKITIDEARDRLEMEKVRIKRKYERIFSFSWDALVYWYGLPVYGEEYAAKGIMMSLLGTILFIVFIPLYGLGEYFDWDWAEGVAVFAAAAGGAIIIPWHLYVFAGSIMAILRVMAVILGIGASIVGITVGLKKVSGRRTERD